MLYIHGYTIARAANLFIRDTDPQYQKSHFRTVSLNFVEALKSKLGVTVKTTDTWGKQSSDIIMQYYLRCYIEYLI